MTTTSQVTQTQAMQPTTTIGNVHNNETSTSSAVFTESSQQSQNFSVYPTVIYGVYRPDNKFTNVQSSGFRSDSNINLNGDRYSFNNIAGNLERNGTERFTEEMKASVAKMVVKAQAFRAQVSEQSQYKEKYPDLTFTPSPHGLLYLNPVTGKCGSVSELAS